MPERDHNVWCAEIPNEPPARETTRSPDQAAVGWRTGDVQPAPIFPAEVFGAVEKGVDFWHTIENLAPATETLFGNRDA